MKFLILSKYVNIYICHKIKIIEKNYKLFIYDFKKKLNENEIND